MKLFFLVFICYLIVPFYTYSQINDSAKAVKDSVPIATKLFQYKNIYEALLEKSVFVNAKGKAEVIAVSKRQLVSNESFFYLVAFLFLLLGLFRFIYHRYFTTVFRVFFNTSLRQSQLTDQLEQALVPSFLLNVFFFFSAGLYIYLLHQYNINKSIANIDWYFMGSCVAFVTLAYLTKYFSLLFIGWLTGYKEEASVYIFVVFLINKVIAILLLPCILLLAFSSHQLAGYALSISVVLLCLLLMVRFFRAYSLLQNKLNLNWLHFFIYVIALEILPIVLIYKLILIVFT